MSVKHKTGKFDISRGTSQSIAAKLEPIFPIMSKMTVVQLKDKFTNILNDHDTKVSDHTKNFWLQQMSTRKTATEMMFMLSNLYLGGANLHVPGSAKNK